MSNIFIITKKSISLIPYKLAGGFKEREKGENFFLHFFSFFLNHYTIKQFYRRNNFVGVKHELRRWNYYRRPSSVGILIVGNFFFRR